MKKQAPSLSDTEQHVLAITKDFLSELESERALSAISIDASFERDLGVGSLERAELFHRIEKAFGIQLSDQLIAQVESLKDLIPAIEEANPPGRIHYHEFFPTIEETGVDSSTCRTLVEILCNFAEREPQRIHIYLQDEEGKEKIIRYGALYEKAVETATGLQHLGLQCNETVAIMLPTCEEFFYAFFGTLLAGGVPVPIYPPFRLDRIEEYTKRGAKILRNAEVRILISFAQAQALNRVLRSFIPCLRAVVAVDALRKLGHQLHRTKPIGTTPALIQYTSGSTGDPKGVLLTHDNLLANIRAIGQAIAIKPTDVAVSWLPLYHDMGLIGSWLGSLYFGIPLTIMSPLSFLNHPERWLWTIHYHRATLSAGPNFAYELCVAKIDDQAIEGLDLSSWRLAFNGAEAIHVSTIHNFTRRFAHYGLRPETIYPVYGLAESSVALTFPPLGRHVYVDRIDRHHFHQDQKAIPCHPNEKSGIEFVSCGKPLPGHAIRIVNAQGEEVPERMVGALQFKGPSAMQGYYHNPAATSSIYHDGWWESGDLAYQANDEIFITGRKKDIIVKAGRNLYPQEIEEVAARVEGIRKGCVVAFGAINPKQGTEQLIVVAETREQQLRQQKKIIDEIIARITTALGDPPDKVVLMPPKSIPKTSSGKLQRSSTKELYLQGKLAKKHTPTWLQFTTLFYLSGIKRINRYGRRFFSVLYTAYVFLITSITVIPIWISLWLLSPNAARSITRLWARYMLRLMGCPACIEGKKYLHKQKQSMIYIANHTSYVDTLLLVGILPSEVLIVAKKQLLTVPIIGQFIKKLRHLTVERVDFVESLSDTHVVLTKLLEGNSVLLFPEGTFSYATGLRPFKLGAFKIATETGRAVCPIAIQGTRQIQRGNSFLLRPHRIRVWVGRPAFPRSKDWREAIRLRTVMRVEIAKHCGESLLDGVSSSLAQE